MQPRYSLEGVERHVLPNGLVLLLRRDRSAPVVSIVTHVNAGYFDEPDPVAGVSHVLEHMYFKGTPRRGVGEIARETKARGGYLNAHTTYDHTAYFTVLPASGFEAGLDIQSDAYANALIDGAELAKELEVIIEEAKRKLDSPSAVAAETMYAVLHDTHRVRRWRIGTEAGLRSLTRDAVARFHRAYYTPKNTVLSIVGDISTERMLAGAERYYGALTGDPFVRDRGPRETAQPELRHREWTGDITQTQLVFGWRTPHSLHADTPALDLFAMVMGSGRASRLYRGVRDRELASSISASNYTPAEIGIFAVHAEVPPSKLQEAALAIWSYLCASREGPARLEEITRAQRMLEARLLRRFESMDGQAMWLAGWEARGGWRLGEEYIDRMMSLTAEEIGDAAARYLHPEQAAVVAYRPRGTAALADHANELRALFREAVSRHPSLGVVHESPPAIIVRAQAKLERVVGGVHVFRSDAGAPVLVRRLRGAPLVHAGVHILGGAAQESSDRGGITLLMGRTAIKGTHKRTAGQIADDLELHGGAMRATSLPEGFGWSLSVPGRYAGATLGLLAEVVEEPVFPEDALESERAVLLGEIDLTLDDMYRYPVLLAMRNAFPSHPYGRSAQGTKSSVLSIDVANVVEWHASSVLHSPLALGIVGDADETELANLMASAFGRLRPREAEAIRPPRWPEEPGVSVEERDKKQSGIAVLLPSSARGSGDRFAAELIAVIGSGLGGRFFEELRDRQALAYTVSASVAERRAAGLFVGYIGTSPEKEEQALEGLCGEIGRFAREEVGEAELERAREYTIGARAIRLQSGAAVLGEIFDSWLYGSGLEELGEIEAELRAVTAGKILEFAREHFDLARRAVGVVRGARLA